MSVNRVSLLLGILLLVLSLCLVSASSTTPIVVRMGIYDKTFNYNQSGGGSSSSFNETYATWLPNYTLYSPFWYNQSGSGGIQPGNCPAGYVVQNTTIGGVECLPLPVGGSQTPWTSDIDGNGYNLKNTSQIIMQDSTFNTDAGSQTHYGYYSKISATGSGGGGGNNVYGVYSELTGGTYPSSGWAAGYFKDPTNTVAIADGTNAIKVTGNVVFSSLSDGWLKSVSGLIGTGTPAMSDLGLTQYYIPYGDSSNKATSSILLQFNPSTQLMTIGQAGAGLTGGKITFDQYGYSGIQSSFDGYNGYTMGTAIKGLYGGGASVQVLYSAGGYVYPGAWTEYGNNFLGRVNMGGNNIYMNHPDSGGGGGNIYMSGGSIYDVANLLKLDQSTPQTFSGGSVTGTGLLAVSSGTLGLDTSAYITGAGVPTYETDPVFTTWKGGTDIAAGSSATASSNSVSIGVNSQATTGSSQVAIGNTAHATSSSGNGIAIGAVSTSSGSSSIAVGVQSTASGDFSTAIGELATASGAYSNAIGFNTQATHNYATSIGYGVSSTANNELSLGGISPYNSMSQRWIIVAPDVTYNFVHMQMPYLPQGSGSPPTGVNTGDIWIDTSAGNTLKVA